MIKIHCHPKRQYNTEKCLKHWGYGLCVKETIFLLPYLLICLFLSVLTWSHDRYFFFETQSTSNTELYRSREICPLRIQESESFGRTKLRRELMVKVNDRGIFKLYNYRLLLS